MFKIQINKYKIKTYNITKMKGKDMHSEKNILIAFLLNLSFSIFEIIGGIFTNSVAILSDSIHDFADAISIGISYFLEKKSKKKPDADYTFGYTRYSILGAFITATILIIGSILVVIEGIKRLINPIEINYNGMIGFAVVGTIVNFLAMYFTKEGKSINQKAVNLHMLEDVLGWIIVLIGSIIMKFTKITIIDSIMSILVAIFIFIHAMKHLKEILNLFLEKKPRNISLDKIQEKMKEINEVIDVHHIHLWSMDGNNNYLTMHVVNNAKDRVELKKKIREKMLSIEISHVTMELEDENENCECKECKIDEATENLENHHNHHH